MPKKIIKIDSQCNQHLLILKPKHFLCRFGQATTISFCEQLKDKNKNKTKKSKKTSCLNCPLFNKDRNYATPTFILKSENQYYEERGFKMKEQHKKKMIDYTDQKDSLNIPKPRTKNNFCSVCKQVYEDYLQHIQNQKHSNKINSSIFNKYILQISQKFNPNIKNTSKQSHHTSSTRDQEDAGVLGNRPMKKIKYQNQINQRFTGLPEFIRPSIAPPPHLNLRNDAYFPRFTPENGMLPSSPNQMALPHMNYQPMTFNYNMNIFMNPYNFTTMSHYPYGIMNPWFDCYSVHRPFAGMEQNMFVTENLHQNYERRVQQSFNVNPGQFNDNYYKIEQKREIAQSHKPEIIVIDDDYDENNMMLEQKSQLIRRQDKI